MYSDEDISCVENIGKEDKVRMTHPVVLLELFSEGNNDTFDTTYERWGYDAGCFFFNIMLHALDRLANLL